MISRRRTTPLPRLTGGTRTNTVRITRAGLLLTGAVALFALVPGDATAQIRASERGGVFQTVDGTTFRIEYSRPQARERELFGDIVPWGKVWTGANWATTLELDKDVTINGNRLAAGKYSVWFEVQPEQWTAILDPEPRLFHIMPPAPSDDQLRFEVRPASGAYVEVLTWTFPEVTHTGARLQLAWGATTVGFDIGVQPSRPLATPPEIAERHTGEYRLELGPQLGDREVSFDVRYEDGKLIAKWESSPNPLLAEPYLIHLGEGMFVPGERTEDGELVDVLMELIFEFTPLDGRSTGFELRALDDELWGTATRIR
ncbi:MAG TPA: DUF2911 domain-containing protein [Longimicrobiales bacterium]|nr:DUF2911 domain-containing protein [Longimicrobiales bacterium]